MKVQEYVLTAEFSWDVGPYDKRTLPAGSFVKPVGMKYVPKHVHEVWGGDASKIIEGKTYAYTHFGFILVPLHLLRAA